MKLGCEKLCVNGIQCRDAWDRIAAAAVLAAVSGCGATTSTGTERPLGGPRATPTTSADAQSPGAPNTDGAVAGAPWTTQTIDDRNHDLTEIAATIDTAGALHVAYVDATDGKLMYATNAGAISWRIEAIDYASGFEGIRAAVAVDGTGLVHLGGWKGRPYYASGHAGAFGVENITPDSLGATEPYLALVVGALGEVTLLFRYSETLLTALRSGPGSFKVVSTNLLEGQGVSAALRAEGNLEIAYLDYLMSDLTVAPPGGSYKIMHATPDPSGWAAREVDGLPEGITATGASSYVSLALEQNGVAHVAYFLPVEYGKFVPGSSIKHEPAVSELRHARGQGSDWAIETVDGQGNLGGDVSVALDSNGAVHVSYHELGSQELRYSTNRSGAWSTENVTNGSTGPYSPLALDSNDNVNIVYYDEVRKELRLARRVAPALP